MTTDQNQKKGPVDSDSTVNTQQTIQSKNTKYDSQR